MKVSSLFKFDSPKKTIPLATAVLIVLFAYYAGDAVGKFVYFFTH